MKPVRLPRCRRRVRSTGSIGPIAAGSVTITSGPVPGGTLADTFTVTVAIPTLPAASLARALIEWGPAPSAEVATVHEVVPVAAVGTPPSTAMVTTATPTLSSALPDTKTAPVVALAPFCGLAIDTVGAVVSAAVSTLVTSTVTLVVELLPATSTALVVTVWFALERLVVSNVFVHEVVPPAGLYEPASIETLIDAMPPASLAVPATVTVPASVAPGVGVVIVTVGGRVSRRPFFAPPPVT